MPALVVLGLLPGVSPAQTPPVRVRSPDGEVRLELLLRADGETGAVPHWRLDYGGRPVVFASPLRVELAGAPALDGPCAIESITVRSRRDVFDVFPGKRHRVVDHCTEAVVALRERSEPARRWEVVLRAYDDGAAFRYRFPAGDGPSRLAIAGEPTGFRLPADARAYALPLDGYTTSYEGRYATRRLTDLPEEWLLALPLLLECPGRGWAAVTEARLIDYAGMYLSRTGGGGERSVTLAGRLSPLPSDPGVAVETSRPHVSPWRVVLLGDDPGRLVESDLVLCLNDPCAIPDTSWIRPGKTTFPWWNGYYLEDVPFEPGLNTETIEHYIDFCAEHGIPYHSLDGVDGEAWYGGPIVPYEGADITTALPSIDLPEVIDHARERGVRLRLWMHWRAAEAHMDRAFRLYREWGIEGVMVDFMDRDDQDMVNFCHRLVRKAAEHRLTVTLHGTPKPTGLERTWPNLLTHEGVLNLEYDKWDPRGCTPEHEVTVPFTRMLAGPLDFHQGSFRGVRPGDFAPRNRAPHVIGTPARTLASYVVYQNHLPMMADYPSAYRGHPGLAALVGIPVTWDDTRVLSGRVGEYVVIARRRGSTWYVGAMNDREPRELEVPLDFLGPGRYRAESFADAAGNGAQPGASRGLRRRQRTAGAGDAFTMRLAPAGGHFVRLAPETEEPTGSEAEEGSQPQREPEADPPPDP